LNKYGDLRKQIASNFAQIFPEQEKDAITTDHLGLGASQNIQAVTRGYDVSQISQDFTSSPKLPAQSSKGQKKY
jgi:hypothetical protein